MKKRKYNGIHKLLFVHFTKNHTNFWKYTASHLESIWQKLQIGHLGSSSVKYGETRGMSRCISYFFIKWNVGDLSELKLSVESSSDLIDAPGYSFVSAVICLSVWSMMIKRRYQRGRFVQRSMGEDLYLLANHSPIVISFL